MLDMSCLLVYKLIATGAAMKNSVSWHISETYGITSYGNGWRKDVINYCLELEFCAALPFQTVPVAVVATPLLECQGFQVLCCLVVSWQRLLWPPGALPWPLLCSRRNPACPVLSTEKNRRKKKQSGLASSHSVNKRTTVSCWGQHFQITCTMNLERPVLCPMNDLMPSHTHTHTCTHTHTKLGNEIKRCLFFWAEFLSAIKLISLGWNVEKHVSNWLLGHI